ncbi:MAG TPA: OmpA family protein [Candidatus Acidoferrales bacterium]|nr:OmpA family protein [Candidatus Acidoferrales bacterium]
MRKKIPLALLSVFAMAVALVSATPAIAQNGKLKIKVRPSQAYVFVDGNAIKNGSQTINLAAGKHSVGVYNYGYTPQTQDVAITAGKTTDLSVTLTSSGSNVSGPFGYIEVKGPRRAAVLLNGKTPPYFVGHVDEFDWDWLWHQMLLVQPGTLTVTVTQNGKTIWSGDVTVKAGQKVTVNASKGKVTPAKAWKKGNSLKAQSRFKAGFASSAVAVAPVTATNVTADPTQLDCGQSSKLTWSSTDAASAKISGIGDVAPSGTQTVTPMKTTTYNFTATGPGGNATGSATVSVNTQPTAALTLNPTEVRYHKIGDKVKEQSSATLNWTTSNANTVSLDPMGSVATSGNQTVQANPKQTTEGPIIESVTYTLNASNACGGTATQTATLHITGSIDPMPVVTLSSVFYPTAYPVPDHPEVGLVGSQQQPLAQLAASFKKYLEYDETAHLVVVGHADVRGSSPYNEALSERRANRVKDYLVSQGISADKIETRAEGKERQLDRKEVEQFEADNPAKPEKWMLHHANETWLAYNRRVDIILEPTGKESTKAYPNGAADARILWQKPKPNLKKVEATQ